MAKVISWDSCVFLSWFKQELDKPLADIEEYLKMISNEDIRLLVSVVCAVEVLDQILEATGRNFKSS